ncbi:MAG: hypothetical protein LBF78_07905 [Treponema sp.]|nr:hypothetical protein [Treponema sp.]
MFNFKISGIASAFGFFVSLILNLVAGAPFPVFLVRPLAFGVLFFVVSGIIWFLICHFLPELLDGDVSAPGRRINIEEGSEVEEPSFADGGVGVKAALADDSDGALGDISDYLQNKVAPPVAAPAASASGSTGSGEIDLSAGGISGNGVLPAFSVPPVDQVGGSDYNESDEVFASSTPGKPGGSGGVSSAVPVVPGSIDILPDLDSLAGAFLPSSGDAEGDTVDYSIPSPAKNPSLNSKGQKIEGDFNPKDLAMGIRTILGKKE